jgi:hypothetical protein
MKNLLLFLSLFLFYQQGIGQQKPTIKIHALAPLKSRSGAAVKLKVQVIHNLTEEKTGTLTLSLVNHQTKKSVDGWFLNIFPFQYFTTLKNEKFETEFPFSIPNDCNDSFDIILIATVQDLKDSIRFTIPNKKIIPIAKKN